MVTQAPICTFDSPPPTIGPRTAGARRSSVELEVASTTSQGASVGDGSTAVDTGMGDRMRVHVEPPIRCANPGGVSAPPGNFGPHHFTTSAPENIFLFPLPPSRVKRPGGLE